MSKWNRLTNRIDELTDELQLARNHHDQDEIERIGDLIAELESEFENGLQINYDTLHNHDWQ